MTKTLASTRSARIDFLRGVSIFAVLLLHFSLTYKLADSPLALLVPVSWIRAVVNNGNFGVTIFFVISGFLITSNNQHRYGRLGTVPLRRFYTMRFARIAPALLLALSLIVILGLLRVPSFTDSRDGQPLPLSFFALAVFSVLSFWHNVLMQYYGYFSYCLNIYWSLSVEEVFYLSFSIACVILKRDAFIAALCVCAIVTGPIYRSLHIDDEIRLMYAYLACFDAIATGCLAAIVLRRVSVSRRSGVIIRSCCAVGLAAAYLAGIEGHEVFGFTWVAAFSAGLLVRAFDDQDQPSKLWMSRTIGWFGRHSYELYLFHIIVLGALRDTLTRSMVHPAYKLPLLAVFVSLSATIAAVVSKYFADPINARLRKT